MRALIMAVLFAFSLTSYGIPSKKFPNVRTLLKMEKKKLHRVGWKKSFLPVPFFSALFEGRIAWKEYKDCRSLYKYLKASHILTKSPRYKEKYEIEATEELTEFLTLIKNSLEEQLKNHTEKMSSTAQEIITKKVKAMSIKDLAKLLKEADELIPSVLGETEPVSFARYDLENLAYSIYTVNIEDNHPHQSIFESSLEKERKKLENSKKMGNIQGDKLLKIISQAKL